MIRNAGFLYIVKNFAKKVKNVTIDSLVVTKGKARKTLLSNNEILDKVFNDKKIINVDNLLRDINNGIIFDEMVATPTKDIINEQINDEQIKNNQIVKKVEGEPSHANEDLNESIPDIENTTSSKPIRTKLRKTLLEEEVIEKIKSEKVDLSYFKKLLIRQDDMNTNKYKFISSPIVNIFYNTE